MIFPKGHIIEVDPGDMDSPFFILNCECGQWSAPLPVRHTPAEERVAVLAHLAQFMTVAQLRLQCYRLNIHPKGGLSRARRPDLITWVTMNSRTGMNP